MHSPVTTSDPAAVRLRPRRRAVIVAAALALVSVGCGGSDETVSTDSRPSRPVSGMEADPNSQQPGIDPAAIRAEAGAAQLPAASGGVAPAPATTTTSAPVPAPGGAPPTLGEPSPEASSAASNPEAGDAAADTAPAPTAGLPLGTGAASPPASPTGPPVASVAPATAADSDLATGEAHSLELLNRLRAATGLPPLARDPAMDGAARLWSRHMAESGAFEHSTTPYGENIAFTNNKRMSAAEAAEVFHRLWSEDEAHLANMNGEYARVGIGIYKTDGGWYGTHLFGY